MSTGIQFPARNHGRLYLKLSRFSERASLLNPNLFRDLLVLLAISALAATAQTITFVQLTDAHLFDAGEDRPSLGGFQDLLDNQSSLAWAIQRVDQLVSSGRSIDFVAFTGDVGLENAKPDDAAREVTIFFRALLVKTIFLVPGNNDLKNEDPKELLAYQKFADELVQSLPEHEIVDLTRRSKTINGIHMMGLNSASFKNGYGTLSVQNKKDQEDELQRVGKELTHPGPKIIFTHIPNLEDPFESEPGRRRNAWNLSPEVLKLWKDIVNRDDVVAVFAGHFHDPRRNIYEQDYGWANNKPSLVEGKKTWVAPPLAVKFQVGLNPQARGLLLATVSANGAVTATPQWFGYADLNPLPDKASALLQADAEAQYESWNQALTYYGQALSSSDATVRARAERGYLNARKQVHDGPVIKWIERIIAGGVIVAAVWLLLQIKIRHRSVVVENCTKITDSAPAELFGASLAAAAGEIRALYYAEQQRVNLSIGVGDADPLVLLSSTGKVMEDLWNSLPEVRGVKLGKIINALPFVYRYFCKLRLESGLAVYDDGTASVHAVLRWRWTTIATWVESAAISPQHALEEPPKTALARTLAWQIASAILSSNPDDPLIVAASNY